MIKKIQSIPNTLSNLLCSCANHCLFFFFFFPLISPTICLYSLCKEHKQINKWSIWTTWEGTAERSRPVSAWDLLHWSAKGVPPLILRKCLDKNSGNKTDALLSERKLATNKDPLNASRSKQSPKQLLLTSLLASEPKTVRKRKGKYFINN